MIKNLLKKNLHHLIALTVAIIIAAFYFYPQIQGMVLEQGDITQFNGMSTETKAYYAKYGKSTLWTNSMFSGMPTYQIGGIQHMNVYRYLEKVATLGLGRPISYFVFGTMSAYVLFLIMGTGRWVALLGGIAFSFSTSNLILFDVGHNTKLFSILCAPLVFAGLYALFQKRRFWLGTLLLSLGMGFNVYKNHYQVTYYLALFFGIYTLIEVVKMIRAKEIGDLKKIGIALLASVLLGVGPSATKLLTTYEYAKESIRGDQILSSKNVWTSQDSSLTSQWDYTMQFSHGWNDLKSFLVPAAVGGSSAEIIRPNSSVAEEYADNGFRVDNSRVNLYWGDLPFSGGPPYLGIVILLLATLGFISSKGSMRWWVLGCLLLATALSMGKNLEWFNRLFFDYLPLYKKFRSPNSIMQVAIFFSPLLAIPFIQRLRSGQLDKKFLRNALITGGIFAGLLLSFMFSTPDQGALIMDSDASLAQRGMNPDVLISERIAYMRDDALRGLVLVVLVLALIWATFRFEVSANVILGGIAVLILFDFMGINRRYLFPDMFEQPKEVERMVAPRPVDLQIMADPDPHYRVIDQTVPTFASSQPSYFHKSVGGYHAAKLRRYEDLIELQIKERNQRVINMLNAKYYIQRGQDGNPVVVGNRDILGNAWFIENFRWVSNADEEMNALNYFDPRLDAIVHEEFRDYCEGLNPARQGAIDLVSYEPNHLIYESEGNGERFAVFSEIWYGPNKGWKAYIDGERVDHIRVNYILRGLRIPEGDHRIEFVFDPNLYTAGEWISALFSLSFLGLLGFLGYQNRDVLKGSKKPLKKKRSTGTKSTKAGSSNAKTRKKKKNKGKSSK
ncbi:MAG: YfhO family protein [Saprospiraceae bacterium]|nr:YfhO family protein [Saprospiraceae bacterium]